MNEEIAYALKAAPERLADLNIPEVERADLARRMRRVFDDWDEWVTGRAAHRSADAARQLADEARKLRAQGEL